MAEIKKDNQLRKIAKEVEANEKGKNVKAKKGKGKKKSTHSRKQTPTKVQSARRPHQESHETFPGVLDGGVNQQHVNTRSTHENLAFKDIRFTSGEETH